MRVDPNDYEASEFLRQCEEQDAIDDAMAVEEEDRTEECDGCKWWSELCAQSIGCGPIDAMCLCVESPHYQKMVHCGCSLYSFGTSVDCPC